MGANLDTKKNNILRIIMSVNDEAMIDEISAKVISLLPEQDEAEQYLNTIQIEEDIDVEKLVKEQNYTGIDSEEMNEILGDFDVPQSTEELLAMAGLKQPNELPF